MRNTSHDTSLAKALVSYEWMEDLHQKRTHDPPERPEDEEQQVDQPDHDANPKSCEELELQSYHELMSIHRDALTRPITDTDYERVKSIVKTWQSLIPNP